MAGAAMIEARVAQEVAGMGGRQWPRRLGRFCESQQTKEKGKSKIRIK
jgi:hypothetical protein